MKLVASTAVAVAAAAAASPAPTPSSTWPGAKPVPLLLCISLGLAIQFLVPTPVGMSAQGWTLLSIFASTIAGLVLEPLPVGAWSFLAVTTAVATKTLTFSAAFSAFTNDVIWLIVVSFFFARVSEKPDWLFCMSFALESPEGHMNSPAHEGERPTISLSLSPLCLCVSQHEEQIHVREIFWYAGF